MNIGVVITSTVFFTGAVWLTGLGLSVRGWRRTRRPFLAGASWLFGIAIANRILVPLLSMEVMKTYSRLGSAAERLSFLHTVNTFVSTLVTALALWLLLRGALAEERLAAEGRHQV